MANETEMLDDDLYSEDNQDNGNDLSHEKLMNAIGSLDGKKRKINIERIEPAKQASELDVSSSDSKVQLHELLYGTRQSTGHGTLKTQLSRIQRSNKKLSVPLPSIQQDRIERGLAYDSVKTEVTKWDPVVDKNRKSEQMQYPLQKPDLRLYTVSNKVKKFQPQTPLEMEVAALLHGSDNVLSQDKVLTKAEERALKAMSLQEARERRAELQKCRALLSFKEAKAKRQKKIKSKKFHRIMKKEREKNEKKSLEELEKNDPEAFVEILNQMNKNRMEERMSLKHKGTSNKFMKRQAMFGKFDDRSRLAVQEMLDKGQELREKLAEEESEEEDIESDEDIRDDSPADNINPWVTGPGSTNQPKPELHHELDADVKQEENVNVGAAMGNLKDLSKKVKQEQRKEDVIKTEMVKSEEEDDEDEIDESDNDASKSKNNDNVKELGESSNEDDVNLDNLFSELENYKNKSQQKKAMPDPVVKKKKKKNKGAKSVQRQEERRKQRMEEKIKEEETEEGEGLVASLTRKQTLDDLDEEFSDDETLPTLASMSTKEDGQKAEMKVEGSSKKRQVRINPNKVLAADKRIRPSHLPTIVDDDGDDSDDEEEKHQLTIAQAFASDDVVEAFVSEKKEIVEKEKTKDIDLTLPGWGSWSGEEIKISKKKRKRFIQKAPKEPPRKDRGLGNVIISQAKDRTISKYQVNQLPFPFTNVSEFESSIRNPVGRTWNTETAFKDLTKPKVVTRLGTIIEPISKEGTFKNKKMKI